MKRVILIAIVIILLVLLIRAWRAETIQIELEAPTTPIKSLPQKAVKKRMPNTREEKCRDIFESLTGKAYPSVRPDFLKNPDTNRNLELDGYCEELKSAFEYQGSQHYKYPNRYHKTQDEFLEQVKRDEFKVQRCKEEGINLIVIPFNLTDEELYDFIKFHLMGTLGYVK